MKNENAIKRIQNTSKRIIDNIPKMIKPLWNNSKKRYPWMESENFSKYGSFKFLNSENASTLILTTAEKRIAKDSFSNKILITDNPDKQSWISKFLEE